MTEMLSIVAVEAESQESVSIYYLAAAIRFFFPEI